MTEDRKKVLNDMYKKGHIKLAGADDILKFGYFIHFSKLMGFDYNKCLN